MNAVSNEQSVPKDQESTKVKNMQDKCIEQKVNSLSQQYNIPKADVMVAFSTHYSQLLEKGRNPKDAKLIVYSLLDKTYNAFK